MVLKALFSLSSQDAYRADERRKRAQRGGVRSIGWLGFTFIFWIAQSLISDDDDE